MFTARVFFYLHDYSCNMLGYISSPYNDIKQKVEVSCDQQPWGISRILSVLITCNLFREEKDIYGSFEGDASNEKDQVATIYHQGT